MFKNIIKKIKNILFPSKEKLLDIAENNSNIEKDLNLQDDFKTNLEVEDKVSLLIEKDELDSLSQEELKRYIDYFKNKASYYTNKCQKIDEKIKRLNNN